MELTKINWQLGSSLYPPWKPSSDQNIQEQERLSALAAEAKDRASDALNQHFMDEDNLAAPSLFDKSTVAWENDSTTAESCFGDDVDDPEYFKYLAKNGGDCSDDEDDAHDNEDERIDDRGPLYDSVTGKSRASDEDFRCMHLLNLCVNLRKQNVRWATEDAVGSVTAMGDSKLVKFGK